MSISVQTQDFDLTKLYQKLRDNSPAAGAIVQFTGLVRDFNQDGKIIGLELEHYPGMTEKSLAAIADQAHSRWPEVQDIQIIHRVGKLLNDEQIVYVGVSSRHRVCAFAAAMFIMDYLKKEAPFWKKELINNNEAIWVEQKATDIQAANAWD